MKNYRRHRRKFYWNPVNFSLLFVPVVLIVLFYLWRDAVRVMVFWTEGPQTWVMRGLGVVTSVFPFSVGEVLIVGGGCVLFGAVVHRIYCCVCKGDLLVYWHHVVGVVTCGAWVWAWMCWLWNPLYYIPSFAERSGLDVSPYPVEDLLQVTTFFAMGASEYSVLVPRNEELHFSGEPREYFQSALSLYDKLEVEYPFLQLENVRVKSLTLSKLQSVFGFTGVYIPFTGEANINVHTPRVLHPATIAHEMAHQRRIAPELEANFLAVAACLDSEDEIYLYSGYLFGLIQLSNALYSVDKEGWNVLVEAYFTPELTRDWQDNYEYWQQFQSPVEDVAKDVYDGFLKSQKQELGIASYGACVDLLVAYFREDSGGNWEGGSGLFEEDEEIEEESGDIGDFEDSVE